VFDLLCIVVAACSSADLHTVEAGCGADTRPFADSWPCVKTGAAALPGPADLKRYYFATGDVVAERIRSGQMTEAEGRLAMAKALNEAVSADTARTAATTSTYYRPTVYQQAGPGTVIAY
jgi:hypothetical protein